MREIKPVKELTCPELERALCLQNGEEYQEPVTVIDELKFISASPVPGHPEAVSVEAAAIKTHQEPAPKKPKPQAEPRAPREPRPSTRLDLHADPEMTKSICDDLGLEARTAEKRVSFWLAGKRVFIIEGGRVEFKAAYEPHGSFTPGSAEELVTRVRTVLGQPAPNPPQPKTQEAPKVKPPTVVKDPVPTEKADVPAVRDDVGSDAQMYDTPMIVHGADCMCTTCEKQEAQWYKKLLQEDYSSADGMAGFKPLLNVKDYTQDRKLYTPNMVQPVFEQGLATFNNPNEMYMYIVKDMLENAPTTKRGIKSYRSFKPYAFRVLNTDYPIICLPGHEWADTWDWFLDGIFDCILGEETIGGRSIRYDRFRRSKYPRANGAPDWGFHLSFGKEGDNLLEWLRRAVRLDPTTRQAVCTLWDNNRDLKKRTKRGEMDISSKEEYQRLPCPTSFQLSESNSNKGMDAFIHQRALDFDGAITSDVFRFSEFAHLTAITGYPKGYSGAMTMMAATTVLESYGAEGFVVLGNMIEWYDADPIIRNNEIMKAYEVTRQCSTHLEPNAPNQKAYDWFLKDLESMGIVYHNWLKAQWRLGMERMEKVQYAYFRDMLWASAAHEYMLTECLGTEIKRAYDETKHVKENLDLPQTLGEYPAFYFLKKVRGFWQYFVAVEIARHLLHMKDFDRLEKLFEQTPQTKAFKRYIMVDACVYTVRKDQRHAARQHPAFKDDIEFYNSVFKPEGID